MELRKQCTLAQLHNFVPLFEEGKLVAIICVYCGAGAAEEPGDIYVTPEGEMIQMAPGWKPRIVKGPGFRGN